MEPKELQELLKLINRLEFVEFKYKLGDLEFSAKTKFYQQTRAGKEVVTTYAQMPQLTSAPAPHQATTPPVHGVRPVADLAEEADSAESSGGSKASLIEIRSPIVGTFYRAGSPDKPPFVKPGDTIEVGSVVCVVEAMKLFNEIESEVAGKVVKVLVEDASPVEYDQLLFLIDPNG